MCKAMEDMRNEAENRGKILGAIDILKDDGLSEKEIVERVAQKYSVSEEYVRSLMPTA